MTQSSEQRPYRIVRLLGQGSMAQVFEAVAVGAEGFERRVALKQILADHRADPSARRSFFDEARLASGLHHGGLVAVLDYGSADGVPFQVLELVDGRDARVLAAAGLARGRPLPTGLALHVCREVAHALHYAHEARDGAGQRLALVHRDVKPGNILVSWSGDVKLGDFGIAFASERTERTLQGLTKGTPAYMSPEQCRGGEVDGRADVFSLGCVLHLLITGSSPVSSQQEAMRALAGSDPALDPALPDDVRAIVARATRADRDARYRTAAELAEALGEAAATRLLRDPKTDLIAWLDAVRPDARPTSAPGRLDALLGAELILGGSGEDGREATVRWPEPASPSPSPSTRASISPPEPALAPPSLPEPHAAARPAPLPRRARALLLALLAASIGSGLLALGTRSSSPEVSVAEEVRALAIEPRPLPELASASPSSSSSPAPKPTVAVAAPTATTLTAVLPPPRRAPSAASTTMVPVVSTAEAASAGLDFPGTLAVGGPIGATVLIDGAARGLTPKYITLPVGEHHIRVVAADGAFLGAGVVMLRADHTASAPLRWSPPATLPQARGDDL